MKEVRLKNGLIALVDSQDSFLISQYTWRSYSGRGNRSRYASTTVGKRTIPMHRMILGDVPLGMVVDHINRNGLDNRRENLRVCTQSQNLANQTRRGKRSRFKGVYPRGNGTFQAIITINYKPTALGTFKTEEEAARAYDQAARAARGEFACLNFA